MRNSDVLKREYTRTVRTGEIPYQANRRVLNIPDILQDGEAGLDEVRTVLNGLDALLVDMARLKNVAKKVGEQSTALLRKA
jgi:hypothetical protein